ncbi:hypothetical protein V1514DRAFT_279851 [Lipomyces japonicus]|uniref:uncharacterized protein n=1 Tax=Lipomyces japonicus TaxID=56871 RepID=UPI0034CE4958
MVSLIGRNLNKICRGSLNAIEQQHLRKCKYYSTTDIATTAGSILPKVIFSGIQPTGIAHLGNFLGALRSWADLSKNSAANEKLIFCIADLHALTVPPPPDVLREHRRQAAAMIIASGVDVKKCILYEQSKVSGHAELSWLLTCISSFGSLNRMTQWKSKLNLKDESSAGDSQVMERLQLGLFSYPVLQAADVLLHNATHVPVGEDQVQHLELTRDIARKFNKKVGQKIFKIPQVQLSTTPRVMSLKDPLKKMSKSDKSLNSRVLLSDTPDQIQKKIEGSATDSIKAIYYDKEERPGVSNLISIAAGVKGISPEDLAEDLSKMSGSKELKNYVSQIVINLMDPVRLEYERLLADPEYLDQILLDGATRAYASSIPALNKAKTALGLL